MTVWILDTDHLSLLERGNLTIRQQISTPHPAPYTVVLVNRCVGAGLAIKPVGIPITEVQNPPLPMTVSTDNLRPKSTGQPEKIEFNVGLKGVGCRVIGGGLNPPPIKDHQIADFGGGLYPYWQWAGWTKIQFSLPPPHPTPCTLHPSFGHDLRLAAIALAVGGTVVISCPATCP